MTNNLSIKRRRVQNWNALIAKNSLPGKTFITTTISPTARVVLIGPEVVSVGLETFAVPGTFKTYDEVIEAGLAAAQNLIDCPR
jgi:hypothetical protein